MKYLKFFEMLSRFPGNELEERIAKTTQCINKFVVARGKLYDNEDYTTRTMLFKILRVPGGNGSRYYADVVEYRWKDNIFTWENLSFFTYNNIRIQNFEIIESFDNNEPLEEIVERFKIILESEGYNL